MAIPTKAESAWMRKVERLLLNPPSDRIGFYTIGDSELSVYDRSMEEEINAHDQQDFCQAVDAEDAALGTIKSTCAIHSTAG